MSSHLILVRHAHAQDRDCVATDAERRLTKRGREEAAQLAKAVKALGIPAPSAVAVSGFLRANETWEILGSSLSAKVPVTTLPALAPEGDPHVAADYLNGRFSEDRARKSTVIWVVGHNPSLERLLERAQAAFWERGRSHLEKASLLWLESDDALDVNDLSGARLRAWLPRPDTARS